MSASGLRRRTPVALAAGLAAVLAVGLSAAPSSAAPPPGKGPIKAQTTTVQILNVSDFHGQLDPLNGLGGAAALSTYWAQDRKENPNTLLLTAGDAVGLGGPLDQPGHRADLLGAEGTDDLDLRGWAGSVLGDHMQTLEALLAPAPV